MINIPLNLRVPPQGRYNRGVFTCNECGFEPHYYNIVPHMLGIAETTAGVMVVWECPRCGQKWMFHYRAQNDREPFDYAAQLVAFRRGDPNWRSVQNPDWIAAQQSTLNPTLMSSKPAAVPVLREGTAYTIILKNGRKVRDAIYHACIASGKPYFAKGDDVYPSEEVQSHSLLGHNAPDDSGEDGTPDPDRLAITAQVCEVINVITTPDTHPELFRRRVKCLMNSGLSHAEAEKVIASTPLKLELFHDIGRGAFAIDAESVGNTPFYNPYTGEEIPDET